MPLAALEVLESTEDVKAALDPIVEDAKALEKAELSKLELAARLLVSTLDDGDDVDETKALDSKVELAAKLPESTVEGGIDVDDTRALDSIVEMAARLLESTVEDPTAGLEAM